MKKLPTVKSLQAEYAELMAQKKGDFYRYFEEFFDRAGYPAVPDTEIHESVVNRMRRVPI